MKHLLITHNPNSIQMLPIIVILCFGKGNKKHLSASVCLYVCVFFLSELAEPTHRESETWGWQNTFYSAGVWTQDPVHAKQVLCHPGRWFTLYTNTFQGVTTRASEALLTVDHQHPHSQPAPFHPLNKTRDKWRGLSLLPYCVLEAAYAECPTTLIATLSSTLHNTSWLV